LSVCNRVLVLRRGELVGEAKTESVTRRELARMMVGRDVVFQFDRKPLERGELVLAVEGLRVLGDRRNLAVDDVSLSVHRREIVGIAGVSGNGQRELVEALTGLRKVQKGSIRVNGKEIAINRRG
jgi:simple sugar transport system ATP-binding protein